MLHNKTNGIGQKSWDFCTWRYPLTNRPTNGQKYMRFSHLAELTTLLSASLKIAHHSASIQSEPFFCFCNQMEKKSSGLIILISILLIMVVKVHGADTELDFAYEGARGPSHWGDLKEEWRTCDNGKEQSPIDLVKKNIEIFPSLGKLQKSYRAANASLKNRGHDIMVRWAEGAGTIRIDGTRFTLVQCHWHSPAEHTINGKRYHLEIHMVHQSADNQTVVIGILYKYGRHDTFLAELMNKMASLSHEMEPGAEEALGVIDPKHIKLGSRKYYRYIGSLTTPPCTEGVIWIIVKKVRTVSRDEVREIIGAIHDGYGKNARPTQPANGRSIEMYTPRRIPGHL